MNISLYKFISRDSAKTEFLATKFRDKNAFLIHVNFRFPKAYCEFFECYHIPTPFGEDGVYLSAICQSLKGHPFRRAFLKDIVAY